MKSIQASQNQSLFADATYKPRLVMCFVILIALILVLASPHANGTPRYLYADPSSYAISLYGINADFIKGVTKNPAGFLEFAKSGSATWQMMAPAAGLYRIRTLYACDDPGSQIQISISDRSVDFYLPKTDGYYDVSTRATPRGALWPHGMGDAPMQNYNRLDLGKVVPLKAGTNTITLTVTMPSGHVSFFLRSIELLSTQKQYLAQAEAHDAKELRVRADWLMQAGFGLMFHWTPQTAPRFGVPVKYADAAQAFNVPAFADMVNRTGARYVIFTANHVDPEFPAPLKDWEAVHPGWTTKRDLIGEIADALNVRRIKLILYIHVQSAADPTWGDRHRTIINGTQFADNAIRLITEVGNRYGTRIAGYWFDSFPDIETQYPEFPYMRFYQASKAGNPTRIVAFTNWIYPIATNWQDYWGGEVFVPGLPPYHLPQRTGPARGLPFHALLALNGDWIHTARDSPIGPPIFTVDELSTFINSVNGKGAVTIGVPIYQNGTIGEEQSRYFEQLRQRIHR